ncbi:MAG: Flp pilus assembly protein CpaB [Gemmatimonadaceae bacterium]|nr:Flp pilus assembly protein CpaB [Gemmatimonadaceae bacterium]
MAIRRYSSVLIASLFVAAIATYLVFRYINASTARNQIATRPVVVAAKDIAEGAEIQEADVRVEQWPEPVVPENAFETPVRVSGRVSHVAIYAGEAIVPGRLAPEGAAPGLEAKITPGKRAMGVRINDVSGMNGMIQPNSRVDILLTLGASSTGEPRSAKLFMENMRVLAMGAEVTRGADGRVTPSGVATIEVTPEESELLAVATARGQIQLVLRGFSEAGDANARKSNTSNAAAMLRETVPTPPPPAARPAPRTSTPAPRAEPIVPSVPVPVVKAPAVPDSLTVQVWRGAKRQDEKLKKDTIKRDTIRP